MPAKQATAPREAPDVFKGAYTSDILMIYTKLVNNLTFADDSVAHLNLTFDWALGDSLFLKKYLLRDAHIS